MLVRWALVVVVLSFALLEVSDGEAFHPVVAQGSNKPMLWEDLLPPGDGQITYTLCRGS